jgi:hypothetical protein
MMRIAASLVTVLALLAASAASSAPITTTIAPSPSPASLSYGDTVGWVIVGDGGGGYVTLSCSQGGATKIFSKQWWFPYYGYFATTALVVNQPFQTNNGSGFACSAKFEDAVGFLNRGGPCDYWQYPPLYSCLRLKLRDTVAFAVSP